jgi:plasmid stability protein
MPSLEEATMANVTVRNIDDHVIASLKAQARANHRSLEGEIRYLLTQQALRHTRLEDFRERTARLAALTPDRPQTDSVLLLREDRDG